ncbi:MAG: hypothetical protein IK099_07585 [Clostridia bacterium]|nr:hypothetical protein [Clostridia bacterium]
MAKKLFIGYDLGDGETITDLAILDDRQMKEGSCVAFVGMTMPDSNTPGQAIPTVFGVDRNSGRVVFSSSILSDPEEVENIHSNFKRCPSDQIGPVSESRRMELIREVENGWPQRDKAPELYTDKLLSFANAVKQFTDALFTDEKYKSVIASAAVGCVEIVFCIGHPTRWDELDAAIYKAILMNTVIGGKEFADTKSSLVMAAESRAAFLYVKNKTGMVDVLPKGKSALLIDMGSSTIDLTAMSADSRNHQYNSGSNYLGARGIDFLILDWYLERLRRKPEDWNDYRQLVRQNPTMKQAAILSCRKAKEDVFSQSSGKGRIIFADFAPMRITQEDVVKLASEKPLADALKQFINLPAEEAERMSILSWTELFNQFLVEKRAEMVKQHVDVSRIILTGSASKMPFAGEIIKQVFPKTELLNDADPSRSISMGLALVGPSNDKSSGFQQELNRVVRQEVPEIIRQDMAELANELSPVIESIVMDIVQKSIQRWRSGKLATLNDMSQAIQQDCGKEKLDRLLSENQQYNAAIDGWIVNVIGRDIAIKLKAACDKYSMSGLDLDQLNMLKVTDINLGGKLIVSPGEEIIQAISTVLSLVAGIISAVILPTVLGVVIGLIAIISVDIAALLLALLLMIPGWGWAILIGLAGYAVFKAVRDGMGGAKAQLLEKLQNANLPLKARGLIGDQKIKEKLRETGMQKKVKDSILDARNIDQIVSSVSDKLSVLILKRAEDIKYVLESK